jgi:hypothetical protein
LAIAIPPVGALLVSHYTDFAAGWDAQFFIVFAQVLPVLLVAGVVETTLAFPVLLDQAEDKVAARRQVAGTLRVQVSVFAMAEGALLYAIGDKHGTTFIAALAFLAGFYFLVDIVSGVNRRLGVKQWSLVAMPKRWERMVQRRADAARKRAASLTAEAEELEEGLRRRRSGGSAKRDPPAQ